VLNEKRTHRFKIGEAFPADDPVARFVTVLAMMNNDWHRSMRAMNMSVEDADGSGMRLMLARQQFAHYHEATKFLTDSRTRYGEVDSFINGLGTETQVHYDATMAPLAQFQKWLKDHRDVTFHYPELVPARYDHDEEEIANALAAAANIEGMITVGKTKATVRFGFADEVGVQLVGLFDNRDLIEKLSTARVALSEFVCAAVEQYLESRQPGVVRAEEA
jgi:hypothetical protein